MTASPVPEDDVARPRRHCTLSGTAMSISRDCGAAFCGNPKFEDRMPRQVTISRSALASGPVGLIGRPWNLGALESMQIRTGR